MLNKAICKQCVMVWTGATYGWEDVDERNWKNGIINCPYALDVSSKIEDEAPISCAYRIEQLYAE
jgi:hypothetical protein